MEFRNFTRKFTAIALAGTLVFGGVNGVAQAASGKINTQGSSEALTSAPAIQKEVTGGYFGGGTFTYTITPTDAQAYNGYTPRTSTTNLISIGDGNIELNAGETTGSEQITENTDAINNALPGVYRYQIKEEKSGISGMKDDDRTFDVDVFVTSENGTGRKISYYVVSVDGEKSDLKFTNTLEQKEITVKKSITGNQANKSDTFDFDITFTPADGTTNTSVRLNGETAITSGGNAVTANAIGDGGSFTISGLATGDKITITEKDVNNYGGYKATASYNGTDVTDQEVTATGTPNTFTVAETGEITWTNNRSAEIPTGVISNVLPFVLVIAAAGFFAFIYFNKKEEEEEAR